MNKTGSASTSSPNPLVSIVIPAYNAGPYLRQAIDSVLSQDYPHVELLVLDDGSTDDTRNILCSYGNRFSWESHANMGQAATINKGWRMAKGDIWSYLSADDALAPDAVRKAIPYLTDGVVLAYGDFNLIDSSSKHIRRVKAPDFNYQDMFSRLICHPGPGVFMKRRAVEAAGFWDDAYRQMPDYDLWLRLGLQGRFVRVPEVLAFFRVHERSQTFAAADEQRALEPVRILSRFIETKTLPADLLSMKTMALGNAWLVTAQLQIRSGRFRRGMQALRRSFSLCPRNFFYPRTLRILTNSLFNRTLHRLARWKNRILH
ncbi:MAG TPA: glycosyltransferase family 2 protein [Smithellaceae bacterium]|nr:glycosyltransferase family 2 protein [Smithellaceae bacterium]HRS83037.1 glycosyltransferase family 2 protein [Smithellaceae bacterium]HRV44885.1 glycosyltransferase family 2 protein [Smithellaceae bacterium]